MFILAAISCPIFLWVGTAFAPFMTELATLTGSVSLNAGELISNSLINGPVFTYSISHVFQFLQGNFIPLIILVVWFVCFISYYKALRKEEAEDLAREGEN